MSAPPGLSGRADDVPRRVWIDAQLPPALARWLVQEHDVAALHVQDLGLLGADDSVIFEAARVDGAVVVITKDEDFVQLVDRRGPHRRWFG